MAALFRLTKAQMRPIKPFVPRSDEKPRANDGRVISGVMNVIRYGFQWNDAPPAYGPHKTLYNRFVRGSPTTPFHTYGWYEIIIELLPLEGVMHFASRPQVV